jgi:hypothetical protein
MMAFVGLWPYRIITGTGRKDTLSGAINRCDKEPRKVAEKL